MLVPGGIEIGQGAWVGPCDGLVSLDCCWGPRLRRTKWGGLVDDDLRGSGFFRVAERDGVFWLVDPDGGRFLSKGVDTVRFDQDRIGGTERVPYAEACRTKYGSLQIWRTVVSDRLASWKFNTVGCWSDELVASAGSQLLATAPTAELGASFRLHRREQVFPDVLIPDSRRISAQVPINVAGIGATIPACSVPSSTTNCTGHPTGAVPTSF